MFAPRVRIKTRRDLHRAQAVPYCQHPAKAASIFPSASVILEHMVTTIQAVLPVSQAHTKMLLAPTIAPSVRNSVRQMLPACQKICAIVLQGMSISQDPAPLVRWENINRTLEILTVAVARTMPPRSMKPVQLQATAVAWQGSSVHKVEHVSLVHQALLKLPQDHMPVCLARSQKF